MTVSYIKQLLKKERRNQAIKALKEKGWTYQEIAAAYGISIARAHIIVMGRRNGK